jgi:hypothetical protein
MAGNQLSSSFLDRIKSIDSESAFELFLMKFEKTKGSMSKSCAYVADELNITPPEVEYLYRTQGWAVKIVDREAEDALAKELVAKNTWLKDRKKFYEMGKAFIDGLIEDFDKNGELPFNKELIKKDPKHLEKVLNIMERLSSMKMSGNESIARNVIINQQHNETTINESGVDDNKISKILAEEGFTQDGEFVKKTKKETEEN